MFEADAEYPKNLLDLRNDLMFSPKRMKVKKCIKLVYNLYDKKSLLYICIESQISIEKAQNNKIKAPG